MGVTGEENGSQPGAQDHPPYVASGYPNVPPGLPPHAHPGGYMSVPPSYFFDRTYAMVPFPTLHPGHNPALPYGWAPAPSSYYYHQTGDQWSPAPYISIPANYMNFQYDHVPGFAHPTRSPSQAPQTTHPPIGSPSFAAATSAASSAGSSNLLQRSDGMISPQSWGTASGHATANTGAQHGSPYVQGAFGQITPMGVQAADATNASHGSGPMQGASAAVVQRAVPGSRPMRLEEDDDRTMEVDVENCTDDSSNSVDASCGNVKRELVDTAHQRPSLLSEPMSRGGFLMSTQPADQNENPVTVTYQQDVTQRMTPAVSPGAAFRFSIDSIMKTENRSPGSSVCRFDEERNGLEGVDRSALATAADASAFYPQQNLPTEAAARGLLSPSVYPSASAFSGEVGTHAAATFDELGWGSVTGGEPVAEYSASLDGGQELSPSSGFPDAGVGQVLSGESSNDEPTDLSMRPSAVEQVKASTPERKRSLEGAHAGMDSGNESTSFRSMESEEDITFSSPTSPEDGPERAVDQKKLPTVNSALSEMEELPATPADMQAASTAASAVDELDDEVAKDPSLLMGHGLLGDPDAALKELRGYRWKKKLAAEKFGSAASTIEGELPLAESVTLGTAAVQVQTPPVPQKETTVAVGNISSAEEPMLASAETDPDCTSSVPKGEVLASSGIFSPLLLLAARSEVESWEEPDAASEDEEKVERAVAQRTTKREPKSAGLYPVRKKNSQGQVSGSILAPNVGDNDDIPMLERSTGEEPMESSDVQLSSGGKSPLLPREILVEASESQDHSVPTEEPLDVEKQVLDKPGPSVVRRRCESAEKQKKIQAFVKEKAMKHARPLGSVEAPPVILENRLRKRTEKKDYHAVALADWDSPPITRKRGSRNAGKRGRGVGTSETVQASRGRSVPRASGRGRGGLKRARGGRARASSSETPGQEEQKSPGIKMTFKRDTEETSYVCSFNDDDPESPEAGSPVSNVASTSSSEIALPVRSLSSHNRGGKKKSGQVEDVQNPEGIDSVRRRHKSQPSNSQKKVSALPCKRRVSFINSPQRAQPGDDDSKEHEDAVKPKRRRISMLQAASGNDELPPSRRTSRLLSQETNVSQLEPTEAVVVEQQEVPTTPEPPSAMESSELTPKRRRKPQMKAEAVVKSPESGVNHDPEHGPSQEDFDKLEMACAVFDGQCPPSPRHPTIGGGNGVTDDHVTPEKAAFPGNVPRTEVGPAEEVFGRDESPEPFALDDVAMSDVSHQGADDLHLPPLDSDLLSPATASLGDERMERSFLASPERLMRDTSTGHCEESEVEAKPSLPKNREPLENQLESKPGSGTVDIVDLAIEADDTVDLCSEAGESDCSENTLRLLGYDDIEQERPPLDPELDPRITHEMLMTLDSIPVLKLERPSLADNVERSAFSHGTVRPYSKGREIFHLTLDRRHKKDTLFPWQITNEFFLEITPPPGVLKGGMRVCAYWSECKLFYPGVVEIAEENRAYVHFDDEDYKWIQRERIRMLSQDFTVPAVIDIEQSRGKKKRKSGSSLGGDNMDTGSINVVEGRVQSPPFLMGVEDTRNARGDDMDVESVEEPLPPTPVEKTDDDQSSEKKKKKKKHKREKERKKSKKDKEHKGDRKDESGQGRSKTPSGLTKDKKDEINKGNEDIGGQSQPKPQRPSSAKRIMKAGDSKDPAEAQDRPKSANKVRSSTPKEPVKPKNPSKGGAKDEKPKSSHRGGGQKKSEKEIQRPDLEPVSSDTETENIASPAEYRSPKIPLLSPDKAPWMFIGVPTVGEDRRSYYEGIARGKLVLKPNDCAIFRSSEAGDPYVGQMTGFYPGKSDMKVVVHWFYRNYEVEKVDPMVPPMGLFSSTHADSVDVDSIEDRCQVVSYEEYKARRATGAPLECETYFRAGEYDPQKRKWKLQEDFEKELRLLKKAEEEDREKDAQSDSTA